VAARGLHGRILAKLESLNPGSSKKDRVALEIVREARADGSLRDGQAVVELTSGNTGTGLAIVCRALGHPFVAVSSRGNSVERVRTGGSFTGVTRALRLRSPALRAYAVAPAGAAVLAGHPVTDPRHRLQGAGYARGELPLFDRGLATGFVQVTDGEATEAARFLAAEEGIFAGFSTGAHLAAAWTLLAGSEAGATVAFLVCDSGLKYLSTDLFV